MNGSINVVVSLSTMTMETVEGYQYYEYIRKTVHKGKLPDSL